MATSKLNGNRIVGTGPQAAHGALEEHEEIVAPVDSGEEEASLRLQRGRKGPVVGSQLVDWCLGGGIVCEAANESLGPPMEVESERRRIRELARMT